MEIILKEAKELRQEDVIALYKANHWSSAEKPEVLLPALINSHSLITAWDDDQLIGLGNAISDGYLVVYYPHLIILPEYQGRGIGKAIMNRFREKYKNFHQQILVADGQGDRLLYILWLRKSQYNSINVDLQRE